LVQALHQQSLGGFLVVLLPDLVQFLLEIVSRGQRFVESQGFLKTLGFVACGIEVLRPLKQQPADPFEHVLLRGVLELVIQGPPQFREFVVVELDHVETVEHQRGVRQMGRDGIDVGRRHVRGHRLDLGPGTPKPNPEILQGIPAFSPPHMHHRPLSRSRTIVRYTCPLDVEISSMAICRRCFSLGLPNRRWRSPFWISLITSQLTRKWRATSLIVMYLDNSKAYR